MWSNTKSSYGAVAKALHWLTAVLILLLIPLGVVATNLPEITSEDVSRKFLVFSLHKTIGVAALAVSVLRVLWTLIQPKPHPLATAKPFEVLAARTVHSVLLIAIILVPLTGFLHHASTENLAPIFWPLSQSLPFIPVDRELSDIFAVAHSSSAVLLGVAASFHIAGAIKHSWIDRDSTLRRIFPEPGNRPPAPTRVPDGTLLPIFLAFGVVAAVAALTQIANTDQSADGTTQSAVATSPEENVWIVQKTSSDISIRVDVQGSTIEGHFEIWDAIIVFDPNALDSSRATVTIDVTSLELGTLTERALESRFMNSAEHPVSVFEAVSFSRIGPDMFEATGWLTLAGVRQPVGLPFSLQVADCVARAEGKTSVARLDFGIGPDQGLVGFDVIIAINLVAQCSR